MAATWLESGEGHRPNSVTVTTPARYPTLRACRPGSPMPKVLPVTFRAFVATRTDDVIEAAVRPFDPADLPDGEVLVRVSWSAINYKDGMAIQAKNRVARRSPLILGVDLAGTVEESTDPTIAVGSEVLVHGYELGTDHHGGFAELARVPADWVVPLPNGLTARQAMVVGTAGFTAVLSRRALAQAGCTPADGPVLVTGASGGVGSMAVATLAHHGFEVVASSGKAHEHDYLRRLGASEIVGREDIVVDEGRPLGAERWAAAVDCVGGATLASVVRSLRYDGAVAASGLTAGAVLPLTVFPFILRNVALLGVDSVLTPIGRRRDVWTEMAAQFPAGLLDDVVEREIGLDGLPEALDQVIAGRVRGRVLVRPDR